jgi:FtsZ-interacting cell division protein YlmF
MPEVERLEELTRALGKYLEKQKNRFPSSSASSKAEDKKSPSETVVLVKKHRKNKVSSESSANTATPSKVSKAVVVTPKIYKNKMKILPHFSLGRGLCQKTKSQLLQLAQKFAQLIEKNF